MAIAVSRSRAALLALQRELCLAGESNSFDALAPLVAGLAADLDDAALKEQLLGHAAALGAGGLSEWRRGAAVRGAAACCRRLHREGAFASSPSVSDKDYESFLRSALHEDGKLAIGMSIALREIEKRAKLSPDRLHASTSRALEEELAYVSDVDDQAYSIQIQNDDVEHALSELSRAARPPTDSPVNSYAGDIDIGILTIRDDEFRAVLAEFQTDKVLRKLRRHYNIRTADAGGGQTYRVAILRQLEQGNGEAQDAARDLIEELRPTLILVVGIAGGLPHDDFTLGDVVVSTRINDYSVEACKEGAAPSYNLSGGPIATHIAAGIANLPALEDELADWVNGLPPRPTVSVDDAEIKGPAEWQSEVRQKLGHHFGAGRSRPPVATAGILASSDRLVKDPIVLFPWIQTARHLLAVEMESAGVYRAARDRAFMLAIRGISDIVGLKRDDAWTKYACATAASFTRAYLRTTPVTPKAVLPPVSGATTRTSDPPRASVGQTVESGATWRSPVATLNSRFGAAVPALSWRLRLAGTKPFDGTKAELHRALTASAVTYDLRNIGRTARWPRLLVLPEATQLTLSDGTLVWRHAYRTGVAHEVGDEQLSLTTSGEVAFQRDTLWDVPDLAIDFGRLAEDVVLFLAFAQRFSIQAGVEVTSLAIDLRAPSTQKGLPAMFHASPVEPDQPGRSARLHDKPEVGGTLRMPLAALTTAAHFADAAKRFLDRVANEFDLEPALTSDAGVPNFLAIRLESLTTLTEWLRVPGAGTPKSEVRDPQALSEWHAVVPGRPTSIRIPVLEFAAHLVVEASGSHSMDIFVTSFKVGNIDKILGGLLPIGGMADDEAFVAPKGYPVTVIVEARGPAGQRVRVVARRVGQSP